MNKAIFEKYKGKHVRIRLKPNHFALDGTIDEVFEDCFQFSTSQKTSYLDFDAIEYITLETWEG